MRKYLRVLLLWVVLCKLMNLWCAVMQLTSTINKYNMKYIRDTKSRLEVVVVLVCRLRCGVATWCKRGQECTMWQRRSPPAKTGWLPSTTIIVIYIFPFAAGSALFTRWKYTVCYLDNTSPNRLFRFISLIIFQNSHTLNVY